MTQEHIKWRDIEDEDVHLFIFIHGLWGNPNHMSTIEKIVNTSINSLSPEKIVTLKPSSFRFWKTYDGIGRCAEYIIADLFYEIKALKTKNKYRVKKLSIVGYSLGGLIARFVVGSLYELGFFKEVIPVFFCTFATPHVGVHFFNKSLFDQIANSMGKRLLGVTGYELFLADSEHLLVEMAKPGTRYMVGICLFQKRILLANIKYDRSVPFFSSFITDNSPFESLNTIRIKYFEGAPPAKINNVIVWPKFVDLKRTLPIEKFEVKRRNVQEATSILRSNVALRYTLLLFAAILLFPVYLPLILCLSFYVSCYSIIKVKVTDGPNNTSYWATLKQSVFMEESIKSEHAQKSNYRRHKCENVSHNECLKDDTSFMSENVLERVFMCEERLYINDAQKGNRTQQANHTPNQRENIIENSRCEYLEDAKKLPELISSKLTPFCEHEPPKEKKHEKQHPKSFFANLSGSIVKIPAAEYDELIRTHKDLLIWNKDESIPIFKDKFRLQLSHSQDAIVENLNELEWIKIAVFHDSFNAHDSIVARKDGLNNPKGVCTLYLWGSILRTHILENDIT